MSFSKTNKNNPLFSSLFLLFPTIAMVVFLNLFLITPAHAVTDTICPLKTNQDFETGDIHEDIRSLQKYLNNNGYILASSGPGSPGNETNYFGSVTKAALIKFQQAKGLATTGNLDLQTRNFLNGITTKVIPFIFQRDFKPGAIHEDIRQLQKYLNNNGYILASSGPGSPGRETNYFGTITKLTLIKFQQVNGLIATGNLDLATRNKINKVSGGGSSAPVVSPTPTPPTITIPTPDTLYSISGSITGCVGPVTIKNNGKDNINIKVGDSSNFTFPTKLSNNSTYNVTVETSYPGQVCYINKSVGIIADNNISDLKIACGLNLTYDPFKYIPSSGGARVVTYLLSYTALANGSIIGEASQTVNQGTDGTEVIAVADSNYHFVSWSDGITTANRTDTNITDNLSVTASFAINTYLVTFKDHDGTILSTSTVNHGSDASTPIDPTRTGYTFTGWDTAYTNITTTTIITAQYSINSYTVTFENWDTVFISSSSVNYGAGATAPPNPSRIGYTFTGWDIAFNNITSDLTVTAQYSINSYTISFDSDGGSIVSSITQDYDTAITPPADPTKTGYTFSAWSPTIPATMPASNATHTAQWTINTFTVTYSANTGGSISGSSTQVINYNENGSEVTAVPSSSYTFISWSDGILTSNRTDSNIIADLNVSANFGTLSLNAIADYVEGDVFNITWSSLNVSNISLSYNNGISDYIIATGIDASLGTYSFDSTSTGHGTYSFTISDDSGNIPSSTITNVTVEEPAPADIIFVKASATGANNGTSWSNAYTDLQTAITAAVAGKQIWVAAGTYYPSGLAGGDGSERDKAFTLKNNVAIYGGFDATDYIFANRNYDNNRTILNGNGNYHTVVVNTSISGTLTRTAILDGFEITGGNANNSSYNRNKGGGLHIYSGYPTIKNCKIYGNRASNHGLGVYVYYIAHPLIDNCEIYDNIFNDTSYKIQIYFDNLDNAIGSEAILSNSKIYYTTDAGKNDAYRGLGGYGDGLIVSSTEIYNLVYGVSSFTTAKTASQGKKVNFINLNIHDCSYGVGNVTKGGTDYTLPIFEGLLLYNNTHAWVNNQSNVARVINATITKNTYVIGLSANDAYYGQFINTIIWGNDFIYYPGAYGSVSYLYSNLQNRGYAIGTNISSNPRFIDSNNNDFRLTPNSPSINTGNNDYVSSDVDLQGNDRIMYSTVDMGVYENDDDYIEINTPGEIDNIATNEDIEISGFTRNIDEVIVEITTDTANWIVGNYGAISWTNLGTIPVVDNNWSITTQFSNLDFNSGEDIIIKVSNNEGSVYDFVGVVIDSLAPTNTIFVDDNATGLNNGNSWNNAYTNLQTAIDVATAGQDIWIAAGTYYPSTAVDGVTSRFKTFLLKEDVDIYGGFDGTDYIFENRTSTNETILSGNNSSYNVIYVNSTYTGNITRNTVLDTLIIEGGRATALTVSGRGYRGGGINLENGAPTINNCIFRNNYATVSGNEIYVYNSAYPIFENCIIEHTYNASYNTNAIYIEVNLSAYSGSRKVEIKDSVISNSFQGGTGISVSSYGNVRLSGLVIDNFSNGVSLYQKVNAVQQSILENSVIKNCLYGISSSRYSTASAKSIFEGLLLYNNRYGFSQNESSIYKNLTVTKNTKGFFNGPSNNSGIIYNSIIWGNTAFSESDYYQPSFYYSNLQTAKGGTNISADPLFLDSNNNFRLATSSPSINTGNNDYVSSTYDLDGNARIYGSAVDMGAYEKIVDYDLDILSPTAGQEITLDTDFTISGTSSNLSSVTAEISTNTVDWILLGTASVVGDAWSMSANISSSIFSTGITSTVRVKSGVIFDNIEINIVSGPFIPDGSRLFTALDSDLREYELVPNYTNDINSSTLVRTKGSFNSYNFNLGVQFKPDGTGVFAFSSSRFVEYEITTPWDISTINSASPIKNVDISGQIPSGVSYKFYMASNGKYVFVKRGNILYRWTLATAWDINTIGNLTSRDWGSSSIYVEHSPDGTKLYKTKLDGSIDEYECTTPWQIAGVTLSGTAQLRASGIWYIKNIIFSADKRNVYYVGGSSDLYSYALFRVSGLNADYSILGKNYSHVVAIETAVGGLSFNFGR